MVLSPSLWGSQNWWDTPPPGHTWIVVTAHSLPLRTPNHDWSPTSPPWCTLSYNRKDLAEFSDDFLKLLACGKYKGTHGKAREIYCVCVREREHWGTAASLATACSIFAGLPPLLQWLLGGCVFLEFPVTCEGRCVPLEKESLRLHLQNSVNWSLTTDICERLQCLENRGRI